jgi:hypothetical protein
LKMPCTWYRASDVFPTPGLPNNTSFTCGLWSTAARDADFPIYMQKAKSGEGLFALVRAELPEKSREPLLMRRLLPCFRLPRDKTTHSQRSVRRPMLGYEQLRNPLNQSQNVKSSFPLDISTPTIQGKRQASQTIRPLFRLEKTAKPVKKLTRRKPATVRIREKTPWEVLTVLNSYREATCHLTNTPT